MKHNIVKKRGKYVQVLLMIFLLFMLAICSIFVILFGAKVYENINDNRNKNFDETVPLAYISNKIRENDRVDGIQISNIEGKDVLKITEVFDETKYDTLIYEYNGQIMELFAAEDCGLNLSDGTAIVGIEEIKFQEIRQGVFKITTVNDNKEKTLLLAKRTD